MHAGASNGLLPACGGVANCRSTPLATPLDHEPTGEHDATDDDIPEEADDN
jgi:hypothetical protein